MAKVITFSTKFPKGHIRAGEPTFFVEKFWKSLYDSPGFDLRGYWEAYDRAFPLQFVKEENIHMHQPKHHTIRAGNRFKKGDYFSPRIWSGKPYNSPQIIIGPDIEIKKVFEFEMIPALWFDECIYKINGEPVKDERELAKNDGLTHTDFISWFAGPSAASSKRKPFKGQIICFNDAIQY